jgi:cytidylate kinase
VMVGRDIASVVVPEAGVKIYLDASVAERARRRARDLRAQGIEVSYVEVEADLQARDAYDSSREHSPLVRSDDAIHVDTDNMTIPEVVDRLEMLVHERWRQLGIEQG